MNVIPIDIRPDSLAQEMFEYSQKLGQGIENLLNAEQIVGDVEANGWLKREQRAPYTIKA